AVAARLEREFLKAGGFVTTLIPSGQQWDAPNGWPPLEWLTIEGVRRYGRADLANTARDRWLALNRRTYRATGKMTEKYDVVDVERPQHLASAPWRRHDYDFRDCFVTD